jgi:hypothetical protein
MPQRFFTQTGLSFCLALLFCAPLAQARGWDDFTPREPSLTQPGHREWAWDGGDGLGVSVASTVHYNPGGPARISVNGPEKLLAQLRVGQGEIRWCEDCHIDGGKLDITVSGVPLHNVALRGSGSEILLGRLNQDRLNLAIAGTGQVSAGGRIDRVELAIAGSGTVRMGEALVQRADIHISGSGNADLTPRDIANVSVSGSGTVRMTVKPEHLNQMVNGSGGVRFAGN